MAAAKTAVMRRWLALKAVASTAAAFRYDYRRYTKYSSTRSPQISQQNLAAKITERYHAIEKALALPAPRSAFGATVIPTVIRLVDSYVTQYGEDHVTRAAVGALAAYRAFNLDLGVPEADLPAAPELSRMLANYEGYPPGTSGVKLLGRNEVLAATRHVALEFFTSRHSTRIFAPVPVSEEEIEFAVGAARSAPAVCNREYSSVTVWTDPTRIQQILHLQGGAAGFGDQIPALAMITTTLRTFWADAERNQCWIDGGLFAMNFMLGLHAQGLGSVPLNWSKSPATDRRMHELAGLGEDRVIIMFIGFGHLPEDYRVAASPRRALSDFLVRGESSAGTNQA